MGYYYIIGLNITANGGRVLHEEEETVGDKNVVVYSQSG